MPGMKFPRTMQKGVFKGQEFATSKEYQQAIKALRGQHGAEDASNVRKIIEGYEILRTQGVGKAAAIQLLETLMN